MFEDHKISEHYKKFQKEAVKYLHEKNKLKDERDKEDLKEEEKLYGVDRFLPKKRRLSSAE